MTRGRIALAELASLPGVYQVTPSWSGKQIAFYSEKTGRLELYVMDLQTRTVQQLTNGDAPGALRTSLWKDGLTWTRDDAAIIFNKDRGGDEQNNLWQVDLRTRQVTQWNDDPRSQEYAVEVAPDNRRLSVNSTRNGQMSLFTFDLTTREWQQLTRFSFPLVGGSWDSSGQWLAITANESKDLRNADGYLVKADGSEVRKIFSVREGSRDFLSAWHPGGRLLAVTSDASGTDRPGLLDTTSGEVRWFGQAGLDEQALRFSTDGEWLLTIRNQDSSLSPVLYRVATGEERGLKLPPGIATSAHFVLGDTKLLVSHAAANRRSELLLYDLASDTHEVLLPAVYGSIDPALLVADEYLWYPSFDGQMVPAILYTPREIKSGDRLPALVKVHGGPTMQWFRGFDPYAQFLADQGYVVLEPNVRGSTGYGTAWRDLNLKDWGGGDLADVVAGADYLRTLPYVDPERIGVMGGSYGGYLSYLAVTKQPDTFKVGVPIVGMTDLLQLYQDSMPQFKYILQLQMGDPEEHRALWLDRSAVTHADKLKAKMLILHGANDPRCPISQARLFRDRIVALGKQEGVDFEYHEFADEGHGAGSDARQKLRTFTLLADFLARHL